MAPELIPLILGPAWTAAVVPFRLFSISLLFRMSSKISDAATKAAGEVYKRAMIQFAYAAMVVVGAIIGQRWGVGGVAVCVSVAMGINWLNMAQLGRTVTGLDWGRFTRAQLPAAMLALVIGVAAHAGRPSGAVRSPGQGPGRARGGAGGRDDGPGGFPAASPAVPRAARHLGHQAGHGAPAGRAWARRPSRGGWARPCGEGGRAVTAARSGPSRC